MIEAVAIGLGNLLQARRGATPSRKPAVPTVEYAAGGRLH
jgi:hypothetical protein